MHGQDELLQQVLNMPQATIDAFSASRATKYPNPYAVSKEESTLPHATLHQLLA
jgi:hypothetical protein